MVKIKCEFNGKEVDVFTEATGDKEGVMAELAAGVYAVLCDTSALHDVSVEDLITVLKGTLEDCIALNQNTEPKEGE